MPDSGFLRPSDERTARACPIIDTIVIAGTGRSGSTWLGEMLRGLRGYKFLNEPFMDTPLRRRTYLGSTENAPMAISAYVQRALSGQLWRSWKWRFEADTRGGMLFEFATCRKVVVKFTRALRMVRWMHQHYRVRGMIVLIRHPCAVISSMLRHGGGWHAEHLENLGGSPVEQVLGRNLPAELRRRFEEAAASANRSCEILAHLWALDYHVALFDTERDTYPWILVPYERLLTRGVDELRRIADAMGVELTEKVLQHVDAASSSASDDLQTRDVKDQLSKWKDRLDDEQVDRILSIVHTYGIDMYTKEPEPDYPRLNVFQDARYAWTA
jgi:hypothetical protein